MYSPKHFTSTVDIGYLHSLPLSKSLSMRFHNGPFSETK